MYSIRDVTSFIYDLEQQMNILTLQYEGSYVYSFLRTRIVTEVEKQLGLVKQPHDIPKQRTKWQRYFDFFYYDLMYLRQKGKYDTIVIEHERQIEVGETYIDIYTNELVKQRQQNERIMCVRRAPKRENKQSKGKQILLRQGFLDRFDQTLQSLMKKQEKLPVFDEYSKLINDHFGTNIDVNDMFLVEWPKFIRYKRRFMRWLKKYQPKEVIVVVGYYAYEFIEACKECNIKVSEIQHGIIDENHSGYSYPYQKGRPDLVPYFVDQFYAFNTYWTQTCPLPLTQEQISHIGFLHFRKSREQFRSQKHEYQVLVISQGTIGDKLVAMTIELANNHPDYIFIYKLHPGEFLNYETRYPQLLSAPSNLLVVKNEVPLYQWMSTAKYMIGAYSTAVYEGLAMGCKVLLVDTDGVYDYMKYLIDHNMVTLIRHSSEFMRSKDASAEQLGDIIF